MNTTEAINDIIKAISNRGDADREIVFNDKNGNKHKISEVRCNAKQIVLMEESFHAMNKRSQTVSDVATSLIEEMRNEGYENIKCAANTDTYAEINFDVKHKGELIKSIIIYINVAYDDEHSITANFRLLAPTDRFLTQVYRTGNLVSYSAKHLARCPMCETRLFTASIINRCIFHYS